MAPSSMSYTAFNHTTAANEFRSQWTRPGDVFSVLLIVGADVIARAVVQLAGGAITPVMFSFGWVAYGISALVSASGENRLLPATPELSCIVINGKNGYVRSNLSWVIGRILRDFNTWMHQDTRDQVKRNIDDKVAHLRKRAREKRRDPDSVGTPSQAGLCVSIYRPRTECQAGVPVNDGTYYSGFVIAIIQLGIAAIPCGIFRDWGVLMITACGIILALLSGSLPQWKEEKWACRRHTDKDVVLTKGVGSQHAIIVLGNGQGLDLEDLAASPANSHTVARIQTKITAVTLAVAWILLLISASGERGNSWFLLAVGAIGMLQNVAVAGWKRHPSAFGIHLELVEVIGNHRVMETLYRVEEKYPRIGASMRPTFFPGELSAEEMTKWNDYAEKGTVHVTTAAST